MFLRIGLQVPLSLACELRRVLSPHCRIVNGYGPSECTIFSAARSLRTDDEMTFPIGHPLPGYRVLVVKESEEVREIYTF